jgi:hypothetical protein
LGPEVPRCCTCGEPLTRVPVTMAAGAGKSSGIQCAKCFYPELGQGAGERGIVSSERTRWWANMLEGEQGGSG